MVADCQILTPNMSAVDGQVVGSIGRRRLQSYGLVDVVGKVDAQGGDVYGWYTIDLINRPCSQAAWAEAAPTQPPSSMIRHPRKSFDYGQQDRYKTIQHPGRPVDHGFAMGSVRARITDGRGVRVI